jgi:hypothetical protein
VNLMVERALPAGLPALVVSVVARGIVHFAR